MSAHSSSRASIFGSDNVALRQLFTVPLAGGLPERFPIQNARRGDLSPDGRSLAWESERWQEEWRNYRGGQAQPIRILSLGDLSVQEVPGPRSTEVADSWARFPYGIDHVFRQAVTEVIVSAARAPSSR